VKVGQKETVFSPSGQAISTAGGDGKGCGRFLWLAHIPHLIILGREILIPIEEDEGGESNE
jgi:hypothetical protein